jgi:predicted amidophosphoribosyltransferase
MADSDEPLIFEEHRQRRDDNPSLVPCARCGKRILATATRCPECGVHFQGEAQEFTHASEREPAGSGTPAWMTVVAVLLLLAIVIGVIGSR